MRLHELKIGTQLALGLGCILFFVILLGVQSYQQEEKMWEETKGLYEHPLQVRRAIGDLSVDILSIHRGMRDLILTENASEREQLIQYIDTTEASALQKFDILYERYLGPRGDIDTLYNEFIGWRAIRDETFQLVREGNSTEATNRIKLTGTGGSSVTRMMEEIKVISDFSLERGDQFYRTAEALKNSLIIQLWILIGIILILSLFISYLLLKGIRDPLRELTHVTEEYRMGRFDARSGYSSENEFGVLVTSFNTLADTIQSEMKNKENTVEISAVMLREDELRSFCKELLTVLLQYTDSQIGAVYLLHSEKAEFSVFESIGLSDSGRRPFSAEIHEGEFGLALVTRQIQRITDISDETRFSLSTVSGDIRPREIVIIPIVAGKDVVAMFSLSSVHPYSPEAIRLVTDLHGILTARFNGVLAFTKIHEVSEILENQNRELSSQSRELIAQTHELKDQNIELEVQKKQLDESNRLKNVFLSNMSHELRTPLNSVIALSGVLGRRLRGTIPDDEYSYIEVIERNGRHLLSLINDILDISRIEAGREEVLISRFSLHQLAGLVIEMVGPKAHEKNIALYNRIDTALPHIFSDLSKCQHILQNIVANAVKFTKEGSVEISADVTSDEISITVTDTGIGIPADKLSYIFDEFRQADERIARTYGGSGLGLSIAKRYALLLGGDITVESSVGSGSTFTLHLPVSRSPDLSDQQTEPGMYSGKRIGDPSLGSTGVGKTILLVEDSEPAIIQIRDLLEEQKYLVRVARNGKEALEQVSETLPDAMILDLMMPEVDGFTVLHMIRTQKKTTLLPVLILTAKHITNEELKFLKGNHIHQLIQKGDISRTNLLAAVEEMVTGCQEKEEPVSRGTTRPEVRETPRILVVEDNPDNMTTVRALLKDSYDLIEAPDGQLGIEQARTHHPDLILLDISLPVMDGFEVLDILRSDNFLREIPVIALTARAMKGDRGEILGSGFDGYLSKPIDGELLVHTIQRVLNGR